MSNPEIGKIYFLGKFPHQKPRLIKILQLYYDPAYFANVMRYITNDGESHLDRAVFTRYYREATPEEILLYWKE